MQYVIGFVIALFIALTGVGAGTVTVPVLVLFLGVPAPVAVGIGLMFQQCQADPGAGANRPPQRGLAHAGLHAAGRRAGRGRRVVVSEASGDRGIANPAERAARRHSGDHGELADSSIPSARMKQNQDARDRSRCFRG
jgi:hypothetical protein